MPRWFAVLLMAAILAVSAGCSGTTEPGFACSLHPAPLLGSFDAAAPGYLVQLTDDVNAQSEATRLASKYGFTLEFVYSSPKGFAAQMSDAALAGIRCERTVVLVEHNSVAEVN